MARRESRGGAPADMSPDRVPAAVPLLPFIDRSQLVGFMGQLLTAVKAGSLSAGTYELFRTRARMNHSHRIVQALQLVKDHIARDPIDDTLAALRDDEKQALFAIEDCPRLSVEHLSVAHYLLCVLERIAIWQVLASGYLAGMTRRQDVLGDELDIVIEAW